MKKFIASFTFFFITFTLGFPCGGDWDWEDSYYNLFAQEIVNDPQYFPFLVSNYSWYYMDSKDVKIKNENIEEWQNYLELSYEDTEYLVFKAKKADVDALIKTGKSNDSALSFADAGFIAKHIQALRYISYAKYLEPYMSVELLGDGWWYSDDKKEYTVANLNYQRVKNVLVRSWNAETDKELKLRYGYQLVRFDHYNRNYELAIENFNKYVESLKYKPAMYYYALDQKAGAEHGLGNITQANYDFLRVFTNTKNIKSNVYSSLSIFEDSDLNDLIGMTKTEGERNDLYLLLGYQNFNNPISSLNKIVEKSPDAIQAKVLIVRAINQLEQNFLSSSIRCYDYSDEKIKMSGNRLPLTNDGEYNDFLESALKTSKKLADNVNLNDRNFWTLTTAYLFFLKQDYTQTRSYLAKVNGDLYQHQKNSIEMLTAICEQPVITSTFETEMFNKYKSIITDSSDDKAIGNTRNFIIDVLANRYYMQKEYGKSFLLHNAFSDLECNPNLELVDHLEKFQKQKNKTDFENYILSKQGSDSDFSLNIANIRNSVYLARGEFKKALDCINSVEGLHYTGDAVPAYIFGYNKQDYFNISDEKAMSVDYINDFDFLDMRMNKRELTEALVQLDEIAKGKGEKAAKANYLIGNFFYNTTSAGYYRNVLRFSSDNGYSYYEYYSNGSEKNIFDCVYFKNYSWDTNLPDRFNLPVEYFEKAIELAKDNELKARITFGLSRIEQAWYDFDSKSSKWSYGDISDGILISDRVYFKELQKYKGTKFYNTVKTNCKYFEYYVNNN